MTSVSSAGKRTGIHLTFYTAAIAIPYKWHWHSCKPSSTFHAHPPLSYASISVSNIHTFIYVHTYIYMKIFLWVCCLNVVITGKRNSLCNGCPRALQRIHSYPESSLLRAKSDHEEHKTRSLWPQIIISVLHTWISSPLDWCLGWSQPEARPSNKGPNFVVTVTLNEVVSLSACHYLLYKIWLKLINNCKCKALLGLGGDWTRIHSVPHLSSCWSSHSPSSSTIPLQHLDEVCSEGYFHVVTSTLRCANCFSFLKLLPNFLDR